MPKKVLSVTIDPKVLDFFNKMCEENAINKSQYIEKLLKKSLEGSNK